MNAITAVENLRTFIRDHRADDVRELMLHAGRYADVDVRTAAVQISAWQAARRKLPTWAATEGIVFPGHLPMEQCSSEATARYKRGVWVRKRRGLADATSSGKTAVFRVADLTGGFGVDAAMLAARRLPGDAATNRPGEGENAATRLTFVERDEELCALARHNLPLLGLEDTEVLCGDGEDFLRTLPEPLHLIYIDPARRDAHGGKTVAIADCTPDVARLNGLLLQKARMAIVKLSPMLDVAEALRQLRGVEEVHVVSADGECKEVLLLLRRGADATAGPEIHCVNIVRGQAGDFVFTPSSEREAECHFAAQPRPFLYEPNASLLKAAAFRSAAQAFGVAKLHPSSHLYTSDALVSGFPGRTFEVVGWCPFKKKEVRQLLGGIPRANLTVRNFPLSVAELRQRLKLAEGGDDYLFATTLADATRALIRCRKAGGQAEAAHG